MSKTLCILFKRLLTLVTIGLFVFAGVTNAQTIRGMVTDLQSGEALTGVSISTNSQPSRKAITGLNGRFSMEHITFPVTITCTYVGYIEKHISLTIPPEKEIEIKLSSSNVSLKEVAVLSSHGSETENKARSVERQAMNVMNVMSAKAIELSPDITVANVLQRMSGAVVERSANGEGRYAILRGMDKRFNYTLVNGIKIPSPDNKNRFVPLDIFPAELLDRLEVTKSLTANMEADGIGGAIDMVMKDAPSHRSISANLSTGYNFQYFKRDFQYFDHSIINPKSPTEKYGLAYPVKMKDFTNANLALKAQTALPGLNAGFSYGDRFFKQQLGIMLAGSFQNNYRGNTNDLYGGVGSDFTQTITHRYFSEQQSRMGFHAKFDYNLDKNNKLVWYNAYMNFSEAQVRDAESRTSQTTRMLWNQQQILNSTLKGLHKLANNRLQLDWSAVYAKALNETPDNTQINVTIVNGLYRIAQDVGALRRWEHNSDEDKAGYLNMKYFINTGKSQIELSTGGLYRDKIRNSYFNEYLFRPFDENKPEEAQRELIKGRDWNNYDEIKFEVKEFGNISDPLNYEASEKIAAGYLQSKYVYHHLQLLAGIRAENTRQGYLLKFPTEGARNAGEQNYTDMLPSAHLKYELNKHTNLRASYAKAINRPSFFEIVPYQIISEDYKERGNPDIQHTVAHNYDLRYEYYPRPAEQFMLGLFYKKIINPIEFSMITGFGQDTYYMPMNFGNAYNLGAELDLLKYFNWFGIKANYTYTHSRITTTKKDEMPNPDEGASNKYITVNVDQSRPLYGQAAHVVNFSLLFKDVRHGWDGQLAYSYTGERLLIVSPYYNRDSWLAGFSQFDASIEKKLSRHMGTFIKASNLLNSPTIQYIKLNRQNESQQHVKRYKGGVVERYNYYGQNIMIGIRYKFS
jgi:outer membrane receptor protein involved in Fe transport